MAFPKPLIAKTKYYRALIDNEARSFLNPMDARGTSSAGKNEKNITSICPLKKAESKIEGYPRSHRRTGALSKNSRRQHLFLN